MRCGVRKSFSRVVRTLEADGLKGRTVGDAHCLQGPEKVSRNETTVKGKGEMGKLMAKD